MFARRVAHERADLAKFNLSLDLEDIAGIRSDQLRRMFLIGDSFMGDLFGWDPEDLTDADAPEYGVYCQLHSEDDFHRVAGTFWEFVNDFLLDGQALRTVIPLADSEPLPRMTFAPLILRRA